MWLNSSNDEESNDEARRYVQESCEWIMILQYGVPVTMDSFVHLFTVPVRDAFERKSLVCGVMFVELPRHEGSYCCCAADYQGTIWI